LDLTPEQISGLCQMAWLNNIGLDEYMKRIIAKALVKEVAS
jgi:hypothetical protein